MPKFGEAVGLTAAEVWAAAARTLTDISAEEIFDLPIFDSSYVERMISSAATAHTFGSWGVVRADVGVGKRLLFLVLAGAGKRGELEIGEGESGSEAAVARVQFSTTALHTPMILPLFKSLTDNARISARVRDNSGGAETYAVELLVA